MTLKVIPITFALRLPDSTAAAGASITTTLVNATTGADAFDTDTATGAVVPVQGAATADVNGDATLNLWPNALGSRSTAYRIDVRHLGVTIVSTRITVPDSAVGVPVPFHTLISVSPYPAIDAAQLAVTQAQAAATAASQAAALADADAVATAADRVQTGLDVLATAASAAAAAASELAADADATAAAASATAAATSAANAAAVVTGGTASLLAAAGKLPLADANGLLHRSWYNAILGEANDIGSAGYAGFGVGICPAVPAGYTPLSGVTDITSANYGNYQYSDGSIMCWIPAFWFRIGDARNSTYAAYGVNSISIKRYAHFPDAATAAAEGYYMHRAFINAGVQQLGFFRDKYDCSLNGTIASSIQGVQPMVSGPVAGQVGFTGATANGQTPTSTYAGAIPAARSRGAKFVPETIFMADALCRISEAHAQSATSSTYCAWYDATGVKDFPKGNNNNALKDTDDITVTFTSAGNATYPNFALAGSGSPFAKTTHNGQACGVSDVAGNIYKINPGMTCIATSSNITAATQANPVKLQVVGHGRSAGTVVRVASVGGMTQINDRLYTITVVDADNFTLDGVDGTAFTAYTSGGTVTTGTFYTLKESVDVATLTPGNTLATDHWGATGVVANFDTVAMAFRTDYPNNGFTQRYGNGANAVFKQDTAANRALAALGMPAAGGISPAGSNLFGADYFYQYSINELCVISRGNWSNGSVAGSRFRNLSSARTNATFNVGFAAASYL